jgi:hypothetical protein
MLAEYRVTESRAETVLPFACRPKLRPSEKTAK